MLFLVEHIGHERRVFIQLGVPDAHALTYPDGEVGQEVVFDSQRVSHVQRAANQAAQDVATALVARDCAVGYEECGRPSVLGDDPHRASLSLVSGPVVESGSRSDVVQ